MRVLAPILSALFCLLLTAMHCNALKLKFNSPEDVCGLFPNGAVLRKPGSCTETIKCKDGQSSPHTVKCSGDKIVKLEKMTCVSMSKKSTEKYCKHSCLTASTTFIEDKKNCDGWVKCEESQVIEAGSCPSGQRFNVGNQGCIYDTGECNKTFDICHVAKTNQKFRDKRNCQKYLYCNAKQQLVSGKCPVSYFYEISTGNCVKKVQTSCLENAMPEYVCGTKKRAILNSFVSDETTCSGYYYCKDLGISKDGNHIPDESPAWGQCKPDEFFDAHDLNFPQCRDMNSVKCNQDRCDGRTNDIILSETPGCQHYLVCQDGYAVEEIQCPDNKFFDPVIRDCIDETVSYPICY